MKRVIAYTDGATWKENPGPAGLGGVMLDGDKYQHPSEAGNDLLFAVCEPVAEATNNEAEYMAVIEVLACFFTESIMDAATELEVRTDSQLIVNQFYGDYKLKAGHLAGLQREVRAFAKAFEKGGYKLSLVHVPRKENKLADRLSKEAAELAAGMVT